MFKKAKRKIVLSILAILGTVLVGTLGLIYIASYASASAQNYRVLERQMEILTGDPQAGDPQAGDPQAGDPQAGDPQAGDPEAGEPQAGDPQTGAPQAGPAGENRRPERIERNLEVGTFYEIRLLNDGTAEVIQNGADGLYTDEELIQYAQEVSAKSRGRIGDLLYLVTKKDGITFVCFMDNTVFSESFSRLFLFTLLFGLIAMVVITFISIYIANRIVSPMEENDRKQKQFTADAGHELKTPVAVVAANLELLKREIGDNKWLENISYENERMRDLVTSLLELARNESQEPERTVTDLSHLMEGAILPHEAAAFEKNILIEDQITPGLCATVNEKSIEQLAAILLDNAISHCKREEGAYGTVTVRLYESKGTVVLSVTNPGDEIPEEERARLFERFYRSDRAHEFTGHYGLGLAIAKSIADANHGKLGVSCEAGNVTFWARFDRAR